VLTATSFSNPIVGADIDAGSLRLTQPFAELLNTAILPDLDPGEAVKSLSVEFLLSIAKGSTPLPADGVAMNFGPNSNSSIFGEEGPFKGLTISFDTFDNNFGVPPQEAPQIDIRVGKTIIATSLTNPFTDGAFVAVSAFLAADGALDVMFNGTLIFDDVATGYVPAVGDRLAFGARTGGANEIARIDDLNVVTRTTIPTPDGGGTLALLSLGAGALAFIRQQRRTDPSGL
jgi:hypothetical protein